MNKVKSLSRVQLFATPWTVAHQAPLSMEFSRQEYWSGLPLPSPEVLSNPGIKSGSPTLRADALPSECKGHLQFNYVPNCICDVSSPHFKPLIIFLISRNSSSTLPIAQAILDTLHSHMQSLSSVCLLCLQNNSQVWSSFHTSADAALAQVPAISHQDYFNSLLPGSRPYPNSIRSCHSAHKLLRVKTQVLVTICKTTMARPPVTTSLTPSPSIPHLFGSLPVIFTHLHPYTYYILCTCFAPQSLHLLFHLSRIFLSQIV